MEPSGIVDFYLANNGCTWTIDYMSGLQDTALARLCSDIHSPAGELPVIGKKPRLAE